MTGMENIELEIHLSSTYWKNPPVVKVWLDDNVLRQSSPLTDPEIIKWTGNITEGEHTIKVALSGKDGKIETIIEDGKMVKDQLLNIDGMIIDGIDLGILLYTHGTMFPTGREPITGVVNIGWNGTYELKFSVPAYVWLLENL